MTRNHRLGLREHQGISVADGGNHPAGLPPSDCTRLARSELDGKEGHETVARMDAGGRFTGGMTQMRHGEQTASTRKHFADLRRKGGTQRLLQGVRKPHAEHRDMAGNLSISGRPG